MGEDGSLYQSVLTGVGALIRWAGDDPGRSGLRDTPARVGKAFAELCAGYREDPQVILARVFDDIPGDEVISVRGIEFTSLCEHHLLPFVGTAAVGYLPGSKVVGLSKLARLVQCYARRLQVQERLTAEITAAIMLHLAAEGAGCVIVARHACMGCRGVRQPTAEMVTSSMVGKFRTEPALRSEFLRLVGMP